MMRNRINPWRRLLVLLGMTTLSATALAVSSVVVAPSPTLTHSTEVTTNTSFCAGLSSDRQFNLSLELNATISNCVEIAFGSDTDSNGILSREEADLLLGWDAGEWLLHDRRSGVVYHWARLDGYRRLDWQLTLNSQKEAKTLLAEDEDGVLFDGEVPPTWFNDSWDLMRVTVRGLSDPNGIVFTKVFGRGFGVIIR